MKHIIFIVSILFLSTLAFSQKQVITTEKTKAIGPYSPGIMVGTSLYISGQIADTDTTSGNVEADSIEIEVTQAMDKVKDILQQANFTFTDVVSATIYLTDMENYGKMNKIYRKYFTDKNFPARTVVEVAKMPRDANYEISVIAQQK